MRRSAYNYRIHFEAEPEGGYTVTVPALPGCVTWGADYDDAVEKARECPVGLLGILAIAEKPIPPGGPGEPSDGCTSSSFHTA